MRQMRDKLLIFCHEFWTTDDAKLFCTQEIADEIAACWNDARGGEVASALIEDVLKAEFEGFQ